jgi:hypothetical protein
LVLVSHKLVNLHVASRVVFVSEIILNRHCPVWNREK